MERETQSPNPPRASQPGKLLTCQVVQPHLQGTRRAVKHRSYVFTLSPLVIVLLVRYTHLFYLLFDSDTPRTHEL